MKRTVIAWLGIIISFAFLFQLAKTIEWTETFNALRSAKILPLVLATFAYLSLFPLRGWRWSILLHPVTQLSTADATRIFSVGFMANNILPARLGDVARAVVLSKHTNISGSAAFANVMLERILDGLTIVALLTSVLLIDPPQSKSSGWVLTTGWVGASIFVAAFVVVVLLAWNESRFLRLSRWFLSIFPERLANALFGLIKKLALGITTMKSPKHVIAVLTLSLAIWCGEILVYWLTQQAFGMNVPLSGLFLSLGVLALGLSAPSAPGFVGVYEFILISAIGLYRVEKSVASAFALTLHAIQLIPGTLLGLISSWQCGLKLRELNRVSETDATDSSLTRV